MQNNFLELFKSAKIKVCILISLILRNSREKGAKINTYLSPWGLYEAINTVCLHYTYPRI